MVPQRTTLQRVPEKVYSINCSEEIWFEDVDRILLIRNIVGSRVLVNTVTNFRFPNKAPNFLNSKATVIFSRMTLLVKLVSVKMKTCYRYSAVETDPKPFNIRFCSKRLVIRLTEQITEHR
jgi:hypothetical protein